MRRIRLASYLTTGDLEKRYRAAKEPHERSWWQILWLLSHGQLAITIATSTGSSAPWIGQLAKRYNTEGPAGMVNRQHTRVRGTPTLLASAQLAELLASAQLAELRVAWEGPAPEGARWSGRVVGEWMAPRLGRAVCSQRGWDDVAAAQGAAAAAAPAARGGARRGAGGVERGIRQLRRAVATAFPAAQVERWATDSPDEHRIGLKPILRRVWTLPGHRPLAPVEPRDAWRSVVAFVHPASGRTVWHLATGVRTELFSVEVPAFAAALGAGPRTPILVVLDRAGWHAS